MWLTSARHCSVSAYLIESCDPLNDLSELAQVTKDMIDDKVAEWKEAGTRIEVMRRGNRIGCALTPLTLAFGASC